MKTLIPALAFILLLQGVPTYHAIAQTEAAEEAQPEAKSKPARTQTKRARKPAAPTPVLPEPPEPADAEPPVVDFSAATGALQMANDAVNSIFTTGGRSATLPLVLRSSAGDETSVANMMEDLTVMSRIIHKNIARGGSRERQESASGITLSAFGSSRRPNTYYLDGYGAVFLVSVKFPLVPPTTKEERAKDEKAVDTDWEQTKMEMYGPRASSRAWVFGTSPDAPPVEYDADKVERLKNDLTEALKNATNIRNLKSDEYVTVAVIGTESSPPMTTKRVKKVRTNRGGAGQNNDVDDVAFAVAAAGDPVLHRQTTLTVRVRKSDADAFAKQEALPLRNFARRCPSRPTKPEQFNGKNARPHSDPTAVELRLECTLSMHPSLREERAGRGLGRGNQKTKLLSSHNNRAHRSLCRCAASAPNRPSACAAERSGTLGTTSLPAGRDAVLSVHIFLRDARTNNSSLPSEERGNASVSDGNFPNSMAGEGKVTATPFSLSQIRLMDLGSVRKIREPTTFPQVNFRLSNFDIPSFGCLC